MANQPIGNREEMLAKQIDKYQIENASTAEATTGSQTYT
jgi:hypothetical protein